MTPVLLPAGRGSWLVEVADTAAVTALHRHLSELRRRGALPQVVDLVPGGRTVLLACRPPGVDRHRLADLLIGWETTGPAPDRAGQPPVRVPVRYDGPDLDDVAALTGLTRRQVVAAHTGVELTVAFCGFSPGFGYLVGLPERLRVPRLAEPRRAVPAGAVAVADEYTGVYPRRSPGGWRLIGHTDVTLWDPARAEPALFTPGTRVRFVEHRP